MEDYLRLLDETAEKNAERFRKVYDKEIPESIKYEDKPLKWWFNHWAEEYPDKLYAISDGLSLTYRQSNDKARRLANAFLGLGIKKGDRVGIVTPNLPQYLIAMHALWKIGAVEVAANPLYTASELKTRFIDAGAETVITIAASASKAVTLMQDPDCPVKQVIAFRVSPDEEELPDVAGLYDFDRLADCSDNTEPDIPVSLYDPIRLQYTSGTSGTPKGCVITGYMAYTMGLRSAIWLTKNYTSIPADEIIAYAALPLDHIYGFNTVVGITTASGGSIVLIPRPRGEALIEGIRKHRPNLFAAVPAMLIGIISAPSVAQGMIDISSLKVITCGAAPCPVAVMEKFEAITGARIIEGYGLSETSNILTINPLDIRKNGTVGVAIPDTDIVIVDVDDGKTPVACGERGELICRGIQVMSQYWNNPKATAASIKNGWFYTEDIAVMDEDGFITIVDRKKDMLIVNGFNVFPKEIEEVMFTNPKVMEACAVGVSHPAKGKAPVLFIVLKEGETMDGKEAESFLRESLAPYKIPIDYVFIDSIPKNAAGKADRKVLAANYAIH